MSVKTTAAGKNIMRGKEEGGVDDDEKVVVCERDFSPQYNFSLSLLKRQLRERES
jgi:hypothetical protein